MFQLNAGYFLIQCASEEDRENVYRLANRVKGARMASEELGV